MISSMNKFDVEFKASTDNERLRLGLKLIELFEQVTGYVEIVKVPAATRGDQPPGTAIYRRAGSLNARTD